MMPVHLLMLVSRHLKYRHRLFSQPEAALAEENWSTRDLECLCVDKVRRQNSPVAPG